MLKTTVGQVLVNSVLPEDLRDYNRKLDKKTVGALFQEIAGKYPEQYKEIAKKLYDIGSTSAVESGGYSFGIDAFRVPPKTQALKDQLKKQVEAIQTSGLSDAEKQKQVISLLQNKAKEVETTLYEEASIDKNPLAMQVMAGARGNPGNLRSLLFGDMLYEDNRGRPIPIPVLRSYSQGLTPIEYWAGTFGARKGVSDLKFATQDAGFFGKQLNQAAHRLVIAGRDSDKPYDTLRGVPMPTDDPDNEGALLAHDIGGFRRNQILTPKVLAELKSKGHERIVIRSPIVGGHPDGGLYSSDVGVRERGGLPAPGDNVGMAAAQALSEPISQAQICVAGGTEVRMANWSVKKIEDIQVGDYVLGIDTNGSTFPAKVLTTFDNGLRDCIRTTFRHGGSKITCALISTPEHKVWADIHRWPYSTNDHRKGIFPIGTICNRFSALLSSSGCNYGYVNEPFALLLGLLLGDGCYTEKVNSVNLSCFDPSLIDDIRDYLATLNLRATKLKGHIGYYRIGTIVDNLENYRDPNNGRMCAGARSPIKRKLIALNMINKYAHEKTIPEEAFEWDNESVAALIGGLFVTDGSIYKAQRYNKIFISYGSTSKKMIEQLRDLLDWRFAIKTSKIYENNYGGRKRTMYSFNLRTHADNILFADHIPLIGVKQRLLATLLPKIINMIGTPGELRAKKLHRISQEFIGPLKTYDIEIDSIDHLFVLKSGLSISNSSKHTGGVAGAGGAIAGFKYVNQLAQVPKTFTGGASHAQTDGKVGAIYDAPAGGKYVMINGQRHFVSTGLAPKIKTGDVVEAGDVISEGLPNPSEIVHHKGIGEGRRYFVDIMRKVYKDSGMKAHRRNIELLARGLINHVQLNDSMGDYVPGDVVPYDVLEHNYQPRDGNTNLRARNAVGQYLEKPTLHYSIGTKITPSVAKEMEHWGINQVVTHKEPPPFQPVMIRAMENLLHDPDWMTRQLGTNLRKGLLTGAHRGAVSDEMGTSFVPGLAHSKDFGRVGLTKGWRPDQVVKTELLHPEHEQFED